MKPTVISAEALFEEFRPALHWEWIAGHAHPERHFDEAAVRDARSAADLVGYLNYIHPYRVQIVGKREVAYLDDAPADALERRIQRIVTLEPPVIIVADDQRAPDRLVAMCDRAEIPLFTTTHSAGHVIDVVRAYLSQLMAERTTRHGVFMDILGLGVLLTGESGLGKSELGLELVSRGHGLVADDAVDLFRVSQTSLEGRCPELLRNLLEVRGIGLLDIKAIFGETAVRRKMRLKLIVHLVRKETMEREFERLPYEPLNEEILGLGVLLTGESGLGKSELGLELISRGHGLVADDAVDIYRTSQTALEGRCPALLQNLLEVRGIGLLDIKDIFGETAVRRKMRQKLIVHLVRKETMEREFERLPYEPLNEDILGLPVRKVVIAVDAGRNLAVLVEAAVRNTVLQLRGIDTYQEFIKRHQAAMEQGEG